MTVLIETEKLLSESDSPLLMRIKSVKKLLSVILVACATALTPLAAQCAANTQDGAKCMHKAQPGKKYYWRHVIFKPAAKSETKKPVARKAEPFSESNCEIATVEIVESC